MNKNKNKRYEEDNSGIDSNTVGVYRTAATVKGGRRFSFSAMIVCGDRQGRVGLGYGKANQVPNAIEKAQKKAKREMRAFPLTGTTIPHEVTGRFGACSVRLVPASPGTGVI
ncbi:MAG: 30S ribosomal protein S5, partial [Phycisphaerales bacterium]|nr:30S ribosomal protein S5 [Phycisphaerales bacterium]